MFHSDYTGTLLVGLFNILISILTPITDGVFSSIGYRTYDLDNLYSHPVGLLLAVVPQNKKG